MPITYDKDTGLYVMPKQPGENLLIDMPLTKRMRTGDTISAFVATYPTFTNMGLVSGSSDIAIVSAAFSNQTVQVRISGGTDKEHYKITVKVTTVGGDTIEADGMLYVDDN